MVDINHAVMLLLFIASLSLTYTMFSSKSMMLGFPCVIFWGILSGHAYSMSTITWDIYYFIFFGSMGMVIFSLFAMYGLREKRDTLGDEAMERGDSNRYIDEGHGQSDLDRWSPEKEIDDMPNDNIDDIESSSYRHRVARKHENIRKRSEQQRINRLRKENKDSDFIIK